MVEYIVISESYRSVGRAKASNPFPLLIPCHWVVHTDFSISGYKLGEKARLEILLRQRLRRN